MSTPPSKQVAWWPLRELDKANKKPPYGGGGGETPSDALMEDGTCGGPPAEEGVAAHVKADRAGGNGVVTGGSEDGHGPGGNSRSSSSSSASGVQAPFGNGNRVPLLLSKVSAAEGEAYDEDEGTMSALTRPLLTSTAGVDAVDEGTASELAQQQQPLLASTAPGW